MTGMYCLGVVASLSVVWSGVRLNQPVPAVAGLILVWLNVIGLIGSVSA